MESPPAGLLGCLGWVVHDRMVRAGSQPSGILTPLNITCHFPPIWASNSTGFCLRRKDSKLVIFIEDIRTWKKCLLNISTDNHHHHEQFGIPAGSEAGAVPRGVSWDGGGGTGNPSGQH